MDSQILSERSDLFEPNVYIQVVVEITGDMKPNDLVSAILTAYSMNGTTMSKIVLADDGTAHYEKMEQSGCKASISNKNWQDIITENEQIPFSLETGELIRSFVLTSQDKTELLIMAHHLAGDGKSISYFVKDVLNILSGQNVHFKPLYVLTKEDLADFTFSLKEKLFIKSCTRKWSKKNITFSWTDYYNVHNTYWSSNHSSILFHSFSPEETSRICESSKKIRVSVNSYIAACFLAADTTRKTIGIPVSIREKNDDTMTNLVSGIEVTYTYNKSLPFAENAKALHKEIYKTLNSKSANFVLPFVSTIPPTLFDAVVMNANEYNQDKYVSNIAKIMGYKGKIRRDFGVTNLTRLDIPDQYGPYTISNYLFIPPAVTYSRRNLGIATLHNCLSISYRIMKKNEVKSESLFFDKGIDFLLQ